MAQKSKRGGPYNKRLQKTRREKVYELYFEKGYPAVKVAQELEVNRNTINADIDYWYDKIAGFDDMVNPELAVMGTLERMSHRRIKLMELYQTAATINEKVQIEKAINDIDYRIAQIHLKLGGLARRVYDMMYSKLNEILKEENIDRQYKTVFDEVGRLKTDPESKK